MTPKAKPQPRQTNAWDRVFFGVVQLTGLGIAINEAFVRGSDRPYVLIASVGMMLGFAGLQIGLRALRGLGES